MEDREFAEELILRLHRLCEDPEAKALVETMLETRHEVSEVLENHPSIEVIDGEVGLLGFLNGLAGVNPAGSYGNYGYISVMGESPDTYHKFEMVREELQSRKTCAPCWKECKCGAMFMDRTKKNTRQHCDGCQIQC